jgi:MSHA pilin protein MshD
MDSQLTQKGFTLIEVLIVTILLAMAFLVFLGALNFANEKQSESKLRNIQSILLHNLEEQIKSKRYDESSSSPWSSTLGKDSGETAKNHFDDVDDFNGYSISSIDNHSAFSANIIVNYTTLGTKFRSISSSATNYKRVIINISHTALSTISDTLIIGSGI